jgi:CRP-like cAMP-binding protein
VSERGTGAFNPTLAEKAAALQRTPLFAAVTGPDLERLASMARPSAFPVGTTIFAKGDPANGLYVVERGRVKISTTSVQGRELVLNILGTGAAFGEIALLDGGERTADASACEPARLLLLETAGLIAFLESRPDVMRRMLVALTDRLRWVSSQVEDVMFLSLPARMAKRLLFLGEHFGVDTERGRRLTVVLPQHELASHMNVARETVNRLLQDWRDQGMIEVHLGFIVLKDIARLTEIERAS